MKTFLKRVENKFSVLYYSAGAWLTVYAQTEPVRLRARLLSVLVAVGTVIPALASNQVDEVIAGLALSLITAGTGEAARAKVSPVDEK